MRLLAHLAGDVPEMAAAEFSTRFAADETPFTALRTEGQFMDGHADVFFEDAQRILSRLGLTHVAAMHLFDGVPGRWSEGAVECCFPTGIGFAVRSIRIDADAPWESMAVEREVGALLAKGGRPVDLRNPRLVARAFLLKDKVYVGQQLWESDPKDLAARHVDRRPFSTPVSLEPRLARALVNLAGPRAGEVVYDPFCGTGGVLLEAAAMGLKAFGSDLDPEMVAGTRANLAHFGLAGEAFEGDIADVPDHLAKRGIPMVDAVVSDLPYGRSATTGGEGVAALYPRAFEAVARVLKPGRLAVLGMAHVPEIPSRDFETLAIHRVRAHKSLTRHFVVLRRRGTT